MTREEAKKLLPVIKAFADGKTIQFKCGKYYDWEDVREDANTSIFLDGRPWKYRIKPGQEYRPFMAQEEFWEEMQKHQPFGWVKSKDNGYFHLIGSVQWESNFKDVVITLATEPNTEYSCAYIFKHYIFSDGTPFGINEE